jgi:hypothetical protein
MRWLNFTGGDRIRPAGFWPLPTSSHYLVGGPAGTMHSRFWMTRGWLAGNV